MAVTYDVMKQTARSLYERALKKIPEDSKRALREALDNETKEAAKEIRDRVVDLAFERGLLMLSCGKSVIRLAPPLSISKSEVDEGLQVFEEVIGIAEKEAK